MNQAIMVSTKATTNKVKSIMKLAETNKTFHVISYFDKQTHLIEILSKAVNEKLFQNPFLGFDNLKNARYNMMED